MPSLERYLLAWILGASLLGGVLIALTTYLVTFDEMGEVFNAELKNVAQAVASYRLTSGDAGERSAPLTVDEAEIVTVTWTRDGRRVFSSQPAVDIPFRAVDGISRARLGNEDWIVYTLVQSAGVVQAAHRASARRETARESASQIVPFLLGGVVVVGGLLIFALRRGLRPLDDAARDIASRSVRSLEPIAGDQAPRELAPLVEAVNGLMSRLSLALTTQRRFLADAAHELRTPVTALRLQLQLLERSRDESARREAMAELHSGIDRSQRLIEQLLAVARSEPDAAAASSENVDLGVLARAVVESHSAKAEHRGLDLGARASSGVVVQGDGDQLKTLLNNLVENALRYTPAGGAIDVEAALLDEHPTVSVIDDGPGIPEADRGRVFDRFYRGEAAHVLARDAAGSGLGLSIVRAIAERHGAVVDLQTPTSGRGLAVRVVFPPAP